MPQRNLRVDALYVYPIKSCAPIELETAALTRDGVPFDRQWAVVRADDADNGRGRFLSQRDTPRLALVRPSLPAEAALGASWGSALGTGAALTVTAGDKSVSVPLSPEACGEGEEEEVEVDVGGGGKGGRTARTRTTATTTTTRRRAARSVSVWDYDGVAVDEGDEVAELLSDFLGREVRLVRHFPGATVAVDVVVGGGDGRTTTTTTTTTSRPVGGGWARASSPRAEVAFADAFPLLVTTTPSTRAVARALGRGDEEGLEAVRFRPNIVVGDGGEGGEGDGDGFSSPLAAWEEDGWASIRIGGGGGGGGGGAGKPAAAAADDHDASPSSRASPPLIDLVKPCDRCTIPHVNPATGERDAPEITRALRGEGNSDGESGNVVIKGCGRTGARLGWLALPSWKNAVFFGWNATVRDREGKAERGEVLCVVRVGDEVSVAEERRGAAEGPPPSPLSV